VRVIGAGFPPGETTFVVGPVGTADLTDGQSIDIVVEFHPTISPGWSAAR